MESGTVCSETRDGISEIATFTLLLAFQSKLLWHIYLVCTDDEFIRCAS